MTKLKTGMHFIEDIGHNTLMHHEVVGIDRTTGLVFIQWHRHNDFKNPAYEEYFLCNNGKTEYAYLQGHHLFACDGIKYFNEDLFKEK